MFVEFDEEREQRGLKLLALLRRQAFSPRGAVPLRNRRIPFHCGFNRTRVEEKQRRTGLMTVSNVNILIHWHINELWVIC